jgi:hypothetical protein
MLIDVVTRCADTDLRWVGAEPAPALEYLVAQAGPPARLVRVPHDVPRRLRFRRGRHFVGLTLRQGKEGRRWTPRACAACAG